MQHVKKLLSSRAYREECGEFVAEGRKLLAEAIQWNAPLTTVLYSTDCPNGIPDGVRLVQVPEDVLCSVSDVLTPQGVLFVCKIPQDADAALPPRCLVLDGLQDPGNVGTILRTADAFSVPVVLADGCADLYNPKTVRATMGAVFRTQTLRMTGAQILAECKERAIRLSVTALSEKSTDIRSAELNGAIVIGSEGRGVSEAFLEAADQLLIIPMSSRCESLNAATAAAVLLWEMQK